MKTSQENCLGKLDELGIADDTIVITQPRKTAPPDYTTTLALMPGINSCFFTGIEKTPKLGGGWRFAVLRCALAGPNQASKAGFSVCERQQKSSLTHDWLPTFLAFLPENRTSGEAFSN